MNSSTSEDETKSTVTIETIEFVVENFSQIKEPTLSQPRTICRLPWRISIKPNEKRNDGTSSDSDHLSKSFGFFLQCDGESGNSSWSCCATAQLIVVSQKAGVDNLSKQIQHTFNSKSSESGFSNFMGYREFLDPEHEFIKNDTVIFQAHVLADTPRGLRKRMKFKEPNNHRKLYNIDSCVQILYYISQFRKVIGKVPTKDANRNVTLQLKKIFDSLKNNEQICTKDLIKAVVNRKNYMASSWYLLRNVYTDLSFLLEKLKEEMKETSFTEGTVPKLFEGKMRAVLEVNNDEKFFKEDALSFNNIILNPEEKNIYEAISHYLPEEFSRILNPCSGKVKINVNYESLPPVLIIGLKRFIQYSLSLDIRFEFYEKINLNPYMNNPESTPANYTLFAVLAYNNEHDPKYELFIDRQATGHWSVLGNGCVTDCTKIEAIENNYGTGIEGCTSAHMLVYIRDSELKNILVKGPAKKKKKKKKTAQSSQIDTSNNETEPN